MAATTPSTPTVQRSPHLGLAIVTAHVSGIQVPIACPTWFCSEKHETNRFRDVVDIDHTGRPVNLYAPCFDGSADDLFAYGQLGQDIYSSDPKMREPHVRITEGGGQAGFYTLDQADTFSGRLTTFGSEVRGLTHFARSMTAEPVAGHFPWCQPGACVSGDPDEQGDYVDHVGFESSVSAPQHVQTAEGTLLSARLCSDASDGGGATVSISGSDSNGTVLTGDELDPVIDDLAAFLDQLRAMRLHLKAAEA
ncbi:DUF6907 domain-containing protein [Streptomyces sp. NPDC088794]|uniref:DUF6907 domain-containing protein n=1 Tax=Streptomyces sp. NPDC088794 TaxID=3365902 RepID=UPI003825B974